jgi:uncharacterized protein YndB with AHSA1/START domain
MKALKVIALVLLIIIGLILAIAAALPSEYKVVRTTTINKPAECVYGVLADYGQRKQWDPWIAKEPGAKITLEGTAGAVGSKYTWEGEEIGSGSMVIEKVVENQHIQSHLHFLTPWESEATIKWDLTPTESGIQVDWIMEGKNAYPLGRFMGLMMDGMIGPDLVQGLENLKTYVEAKKPEMKQE